VSCRIILVWTLRTNQNPCPSTPGRAVRYRSVQSPERIVHATDSLGGKAAVRANDSLGALSKEKPLRCAARLGIATLRIATLRIATQCLKTQNESLRWVRPHTVAWRTGIRLSEVTRSALHSIQQKKPCFPRYTTLRRSARSTASPEASHPNTEGLCG